MLPKEIVYGLQSQLFSKMKDFSRSHAVTDTVNVVISRKLCQMALLLGDNGLLNSGNSDDPESAAKYLSENFQRQSCSYIIPLSNCL